MAILTDIPSTLGRRAEQTYQELLADIRRGVFPARSRLPTEQELCGRYGVGRHSVRQALGRLAEAGHIVTRQGSGSVVCAVGEDRVDVISVMYDGSLRELTIVQDLALAKGCVLGLFSQSRRHWEPAAEAEFLHRVRDQRHRALLAFCSPVEPRNDALLAELDDAGVRVVHIEHYREALPDQAYILPDYRGAGYAGATALMLAGYGRLIYVAMDTDGPFARLIEQGFLEAVTQQRGEPQRRLGLGTTLQPNYFSMPRVGRDADADERLAQLFAVPGRVGLLCSTGDRAMVLRREAERLGLSVPERLGIVAVETLNGSQPQIDLDTLRFDRLATFERAMEAAVEPIFSRPRELRPPHLERHGSCRKPIGE